MNKIFVSFSKKSNENIVKWVFETIKNIWQTDIRIVELKDLLLMDLDKIKNGDVLIFYGEESLKIFKNKFKIIKILSSELLARETWTDNNIEKIYHNCISRINPIIENNIPFFFHCSKEESLKTSLLDDVTCIRVDPIASIFFVLSRISEYCRTEKDRHGRYIPSDNCFDNNNYSEIPLVNIWAEWLWEKVTDISPSLSVLRKNIENNFSILLSHDVDILLKYSYKTLLKGYFKGQNINNTVKCLLGKTKDPYNTFNSFIEWEKKYGFKSVFLFIAGGSHPLDKAYSIKSKCVQKTIKNIRSHNFKIGLHGSYSSGDNPGLLKKETNILKKILGYEEELKYIRQHYLKIKIPETWQAQESAGFNYDLSLACASKTGFRAGICHPFNPIDLRSEQKPFAIKEIPLNIMDATLRFYEKLTPESALEKISKTAQTVKKYGGVLSILWHNTSIDPDEWKGWEHIYPQVLRMLSEMNAKDFLDIES